MQVKKRSTGINLDYPLLEITLLVVTLLGLLLQGDHTPLCHTPILTSSPVLGGCRIATIPCTLALLGSAFSSCTWMHSGLTSRVTGLEVVLEMAQTSPGWCWTSIQ